MFSRCRSVLPCLALVACGTPSADTDALRAELLERVERDQHFRSLDFGSMTDDERREAFAKGGQVDRDNTAWLKSVVEASGWPSADRVGAEGAHAAWLLVQHADHDPAFQAKCLPLLRAAAERGEGSLGDVAYLTDRVLVKEGKPQLYGTQYDFVRAPDGSLLADAEGKVQALPPLVEDAARLDERRLAMGLGPWRDYEAHMAQLQEREPFDAPRSAEAAR